MALTDLCCQVEVCGGDAFQEPLLDGRVGASKLPQGFKFFHHGAIFIILRDVLFHVRVGVTNGCGASYSGLLYNDLEVREISGDLEQQFAFFAAILSCSLEFGLGDLDGLLLKHDVHTITSLSVVLFFMLLL